jgi:hypothetical protein
MAFDRAAHRTQTARIAAHQAGGEVLLKWRGQGEAFPAAIAAERASEVRALEAGQPRLCLVTIARDARGVVTDTLVFAGERPRYGQHFTDADGKILRIQEDISVPHAAVFVYRCGTYADEA